MMLIKQRGITLIELMIAITLSMIIMLFVSNILLTSSRTAMQSEGLAQAQENGRFILSWLQANVRSAGLPYPSNVSNERLEPFMPACSGSDLPPAEGANCNFDSSETGLSDRLAIKRTLISDSEFKTDNSDKDCSGALISSVADGESITDVYWVERTNNAYGGVLKCVTYNNQNQSIGGAQEIANGIEGMQVLYGIKPNIDERYRSNVNRYVSLSDLPTPVDWNQVGAIRVAVLTRAFTERSTEKKKRSYILLDAAPITFDDAVSRNIQSTTIFLANE